MGNGFKIAGDARCGICGHRRDQHQPRGPALCAVGWDTARAVAVMAEAKKMGTCVLRALGEETERQRRGNPCECLGFHGADR